METDAIILAAGASRRMGVPKLLLPAGPGKTLLYRVLSLAALTTHVDQVTLVTGHSKEVILAETWRWQESKNIRNKLEIIYNPGYDQGIASSLACAIQQANPEKPTFLFHADQPMVSFNDIEQLIRSYQRRVATISAVAFIHKGPRPPAIIAPSVFAQLLALEDDHGIRSFLQESNLDTLLLTPKDPTGLVDINSWAIYARVAKSLGWNREPNKVEQIQSRIEPTMIEAVNEALDEQPIPFLAPGILFATSYQPIRTSVPVVIPGSLLPGSGLDKAIVAQALTPTQYLESLRQAALWTLNNHSILSVD